MHERPPKSEHRADNRDTKNEPAPGNEIQGAFPHAANAVEQQWQSLRDELPSDAWQKLVQDTLHKAAPEDLALASATAEKAADAKVREKTFLAKFRDRFSKKIAGILAGIVLQAALPTAIDAQRRFTETLTKRAVQSQKSTDYGETPRKNNRRNRETLVSDMRDLHPELRAEIVKELLDALPKGMADNIESISYSGTTYDTDPAYGLSGGWPLAWAQGNSRQKTKIIFHEPSKYGSVKTLAETLRHEGGHAVDWDRSDMLRPEERDALKAQIGERLKDRNHFKSAYVEAINNKDKAVEIERKKTEYFAEIMEAYLSGKDLPKKDRQIAEEVVRKLDPNFDRDTAREKQDAVLARMQEQDIGDLIETLGISESGKTLERLWFADHLRRPDSLIDQEGQYRARQQLFEFIVEEANTDERRDIAEAVLVALQARERLLHAFKKEEGAFAARESEARAQLDYAAAYDKVGKLLTSNRSPKEDRAFAAEIRDLASREGIVFNGARGTLLQKGEFFDLLDPNTIDAPEWIAVKFQKKPSMPSIQPLFNEWVESDAEVEDDTK